MDLVAIDILSGLPATADGCKYLLVATDYFTKWLEAISLCNAEAPTCMRPLYSAFFSRFRLPRQLHSDKGSNFQSKRLSWWQSISPNMAMLGREVLLLASLIVQPQPPEEPVAVTTSFAAEFHQNMRNAHASVRRATSRAAKTQKNYFDKNVKGPPFALNQLVWLYWPRPLLRTRSRKSVSYTHLTLPTIYSV